MSRITPRFWGKIINNRLVLNSPRNFNEYVSRLSGEVFVTVDKIKRSRTLNQNAYYWLYLGLVASETGDSANDLHEYFKRKLLPPRIVKVMKKEIKIPATTTILNKIEFGEYLDRIAALTGVPLPDINSVKI
jgi:hypothetical protein